MLEGGFDGFTGQFACRRYGRGFDRTEYLPVGHVVGRGFELASQQQGVLDQKRLERRVCVERAA